MFWRKQLIDPLDQPVRGSRWSHPVPRTGMGRLSTVAICTSHIAFGDFGDQVLQCGMPKHSGNGVPFDAAHMVKFENNWISFAAIDAWVGFQILGDRCLSQEALLSLSSTSASPSFCTSTVVVPLPFVIAISARILPPFHPFAVSIRVAFRWKFQLAF